jgi:hypothetical protein
MIGSYVYARVQFDHPAGLATVTRLRGGKAERVGRVTKIEPYVYMAEGWNGTKREFRAGTRMVVDEAALFGDAARWSVGGFNHMTEEPRPGERKCWDCGSTIPRRHTPLCEMAGKGHARDLSQKPGTQWWTGEVPQVAASSGTV